MAVELMIIRHGESEGNIGRSTDPDCALSEKGLEQARQLALRLTEHDLSGFAGLTSPYRRARQTAEEIALATGLTFTVDEDIREWAAAATIGGRHYPAESREELAERLRGFLRRQEGRKLLLVSHAAPIAVLTHLAWGETPRMDGEFWAGVGNCCMRWLKTTCV